MASNLIALRQSKVIFGLSCAKTSKAFLRQRLLQKLSVSQRNGVVDRSGDGFILGCMIVTSRNPIVGAIEQMGSEPREASRVHK